MSDAKRRRVAMEGDEEVVPPKVVTIVNVCKWDEFGSCEAMGKFIIPDDKRRDIVALNSLAKNNLAAGVDPLVETRCEQNHKVFTFTSVLEVITKNKPQLKWIVDKLIEPKVEAVDYAIVAQADICMECSYYDNSNFKL
jgi:hypothetical protein